MSLHTPAAAHSSHCERDLSRHEGHDITEMRGQDGTKAGGEAEMKSTEGESQRGAEVLPALARSLVHYVFQSKQAAERRPRPLEGISASLRVSHAHSASKAHV